MRYVGELVRILTGPMEGFIGEACELDLDHSWYAVDLSALDPEDDRYVYPLCEDELELYVKDDD